MVFLGNMFIDNLHKRVNVDDDDDDNNNNNNLSVTLPINPLDCTV